VKPQIIPREDHCVSLSQISENALKVLYRLKNAGYKAYLVGGGVRDLLIGIQPKDFDVVTDAKPEQIRELFRNCRLIGRRFRLAHVRFGREIIEVSTFRAPHHAAEGEGHTEEGRIIRDNVYGDIDDDVWRRDFTINALFYNIEDNSITDYVSAISDIEAKQLRLIGEPTERYREDPVRMLRAVRFAAKLNFEIHTSAEKIIFELKHLLNEIPSARLFEEFLKLFMSGHALASFEQLRRYELFEYLCPQANQILNENNNNFTHELLMHAFRNTDMRLAEDKPVTPAFLIAAMLWGSLCRLVDENKSNGLNEMDAIHLASDAVISRQVSSLAIPRRFSRIAREIWNLQLRIKNRQGKRPYRLLSHPRFRAAYDFLLLRADAGENVKELVDWWTNFQEEHSEQYGYRPRESHRSYGHRHRKRRKDLAK
jgi:poly(A) polymerase